MELQFPLSVLCICIVVALEKVETKEILEKIQIWGIAIFFVCPVYWVGKKGIFEEIEILGIAIFPVCRLPCGLPGRVEKT